MAKKEKLSFEELLEQALVKDEDKPYEVPSNWVWTRLEYLGDVRGGKRLPQGCSLLDEITPYPYLRVVDFGDRTINTTNIQFLDESTYGKISNYTISNQDVYVSIAGTIGKVGIIQDDLSGANLTENAAKIINLKQILKEYLCLVLCSSELQKQIIDSTTTTTQSKLALFRIGRFKIPLPPLSEQQRIVDLIESLFEKLDRAKELVQNALDSFENRKSAILHKAFTGELTVKWREVNLFTPVKSIIKDIEEERYNLQKKRSIAKSFSYKESAQIEVQGRTKGIDELFELPKTWDWVSLGQVTWNISDGPHFSPNYVDKEIGVPIISARNIKYKNIDFDDAKYVSNEDYQEFIKRGKPEIGDVLLTKGGTTGIPTTVDTDKEFCVWVHIALLKIIRKYALPEYIRDVLSSILLYRQSQEQTHGVGNQDLGLTRMIYMALPLPPLAEQIEIVRILENLLENEQKAKELYDVIESIDLMKKSILARAFRGELSTNNPNVESALELLKEVLKEKN